MVSDNFTIYRAVKMVYLYYDPKPKNLTNDIAETNNLLDVRKDKADEFQAVWVKWLENFEYEKETTDTTSTYITPQSLSYMHIYPNPVENYLHIDVNLNKNGQIHIFDTSGRLVISQEFSESTVDVSGLMKGEYFVQVTTGKGMSYRQKIIKL